MEKFKYAVLDFANKQGWAGVLFVEEQVSGRKSYKARRLGELVERLKKRGCFNHPRAFKIVQVD